MSDQPPEDQPPEDQPPGDRLPEDLLPGDGDRLPEDLLPEDLLPEDLDVTAYVGPYLFPDIRRRRVTAYLLVVLAIVGLASGIGSTNRGLIGGGILLAVIGAWCFVAAWPLRIDQTEALAVASRTAGFPVGHASAQLGWRGLRSRPSWRILLYSADSPPSMRGLVELDAVDAQVLGEYLEENPEDWSRYGLDGTAGDDEGA